MDDIFAHAQKRLKSLCHLDEELETLRTELLSYAQSDNLEDLQSYLVTAEALAAAARGNFGVGAALFTKEGEFILSGQNALFNPRFDSAAHAEMRLLDEAEKMGFIKPPTSQYILVSSLESCPMCLARIITAQIGILRHVADDPKGGMALHMDKMPPVWQKLASGMVIRRADCMQGLRELSLRIVDYSSSRLNGELSKRFLGNKKDKETRGCCGGLS
jgi:tRNA(adenine34) deaminase